MSDSVPEIIGGSDGGSRTTDPIGVNPIDQNEYELQSNDIDPDVAVMIYGPLAITQTLAILLLWFVWLENGATLKGLYWWTWFSALLAVCISWGPVTLFWPGIFFEIDVFDYIFYLTALASIDGPMFGYAFPLVLVLLAYLFVGDTGLYVKNQVHFWLGWSFAVLYTAASIVFQIIVIPSIGVWYDRKQAAITEAELEQALEEETAAQDDEFSNF